MHATPHRVSRWNAGMLFSLMLGLLVGLLFAGSPRVGRAAEELVELDPSRLERTDQQGMVWDPQVDGMLRDGSNDCFDGALELKVNGSTFSPSISRKMTADASELVLRGSVGGIRITRRIRFDMELGAARYVEVLHNSTSNLAPVQVMLSTSLGAKASEIVSNTGDPMNGGMLENGEIGIVADQRGGTRPGVLFALSTPGSTMEPTIQIKDRRRFVFVWNLKLAAGQRVALLHTVAQRRWQDRPDGDALEAVFAPFLERRWVLGLPPSVRKALVNFRGSGPGSSVVSASAAADGQVHALAKRYDIQRGEDSILFVEADVPLGGAVLQKEGEDQTLEIDTAQGLVRLELREVAAIVGGGNHARAMRLYLRNGEVLVGAITTSTMKFRTRAGLLLPLDPAGIEALFLPTHESDGAAPSEAESYLSLLGGTRLALAPAGDLVLQVATGWGDLRIPFAHILEVRHVREPRPGLHIHLDDGSSFPIAILSDPLRVESLRFGALVVPPSGLSAWRRHGVAAPPLARYGKAVGPERTHVCLLGNTFVVGVLDSDTIHLRGAAGAVPLSVAKLRHIERRSGDVEEGGLFVWSLRNGETLRGQIEEPLLPLRTPYGLCHVPTRYLVGLRFGTPTDEEKGD